MLHIKRLELTNFKSFGGTTVIPVLPGFTVVSGPNGSGKSNILDALLFCLGISTSKGMRAERLPDLVNHNQARSRGTVEASVTVTFDLGENSPFEEEVVPNVMDTVSVAEVAPETPIVEETAPESPDSGAQAAQLLAEVTPETPVVEETAPESPDSGAQAAQLLAEVTPETPVVEETAPESPDSGAEAEDASAPGEGEEIREQENPEPQEGNGTVAPEAGESAVAQGPETPESESESKNEWSITRRLRVTKGGTYTSTYYMDGEPCTLTQLHEQMNRLRIYPEGYNVVLQGDVTAIISMNGRERREIIDELAGVAAFDRKIAQAKTKLDEVKEREDRCRIVEKELTVQLERLAKDRAKAEQYQKLRGELHEKEQLVAVLNYRLLKQQSWKLREQIEAGDRFISELRNQITTISGDIQKASSHLEELNAKVKALGEEELISLQSSLATQEAEQRQLQQRQQELESAREQTRSALAQNQQEVKELQENLQKREEERELEKKAIAAVQQNRDETQKLLQAKREQASAIAAASEEWVQQQTTLHRQIETLQKTLDPQRTEQARLSERRGQLREKIAEQEQTHEQSQQELSQKKQALSELEERHKAAIAMVQSLAEKLAAAEEELQVQQETQKRLLEEQRSKQRRLDKLEAQTQAMQEASGTGASKIILQTGIPGVCGSVAQLGRVDPHYQRALETAAGGRLGFVVVEDDKVAAAAIELLKQKRAGRATFLPLNKIRPPRFSPVDALRNAPGFIDYAVNLIECDRPYLQVFAYVFGSTVVFETLDLARSFLGKARIVTLDGELLETSGAMSGGSYSHRSTLHFGTGSSSDSEEATALQERLEQIEAVLESCSQAIANATAEVKRRSGELMEAKQQQRELQLFSEQLHKEIGTLQTTGEQLQQQLVKNRQELVKAEAQLQQLAAEVPAQETQLQQLRHALAAMEESGQNREWQEIQAQVRNLETQSQEWEQSLSAAQLRLQDLGNQHQRIEEKIHEAKQRAEGLSQHENQSKESIAQVEAQLKQIGDRLAQTRQGLEEIEAKLGTEKEMRDRAEAKLRELHLGRQQLEWQLQKLQETQQGRREQLAALNEELQQKAAELPDPPPKVPDNMENRLASEVQELQKEVRSLQKRITAIEPVNMLALEEYDSTQTRLQELSQKLSTLEAERTEILLRIENFTTLRLRAFQEAFDAVNENFKTIFEELSEGDGFLQLDDESDPFSSGLNLVAHPKGKPVKRLASMSGGEKSLTALSFIFALQRYRPSPFYAFDEVDMFLDGANVERLAKIIKQQANVAQFIVVSHKTPMLKLASRVIGVTQARGAYTQVIGLQLDEKSNVL